MFVLFLGKRKFIFFVLPIWIAAKFIFLQGTNFIFFLVLLCYLTRQCQDYYIIKVWGLCWLSVIKWDSVQLRYKGFYVLSVLISYANPKYQLECCHGYQLWTAKEVVLSRSGVKSINMWILNLRIRFAHSRI